MLLFIIMQNLSISASRPTILLFYINFSPLLMTNHLISVQVYRLTPVNSSAIDIDSVSKQQLKIRNRLIQTELPHCSESYS